MVLMEDMRGAGVTPSNYTLSIIVKLLGRARRLNQAFTIVDSLSSMNGFRANVHVYTCLMQACFQNRKVDQALNVNDAMISEGCQPDQKFYSAMARGCAQAGPRTTSGGIRSSCPARPWAWSPRPWRRW